MKYVVYLVFAAMIFISADAFSQSDYGTHVVQENESIWKIAEKYGVSVTQIKRIERGENWKDVNPKP